LIFGAGLFMAIYILTRATGKYFGVSLVFTGITVSVLTTPAPECAKIVQGTIAAAAVINEVIAVITAKKGFEWAGELKGSKSKNEDDKYSIL